MFLPACDVILVGVTAPQDVVAGKSFEIVVEGQQLTNQGGLAAAVIQLPPGFTLDEGWATVADHTVVINDPAVLGLYTPEPGHSVVSISGGGGFIIQASAVFRVRAPDHPASATFKVSLAAQTSGIWSAQQPGTGGDFANHVDPGASVTVDVHCPGLAVAPPWAGLSHGLPASGANVDGRDLEIGDVDGDGLQDIVAVAYDLNQNTSTVVIRRNTGNGFETAVAPASPGWVTGPQDIALGDFNGDGNLDVADDTGRVFFGDGGTSWVESSYSIDAFSRVESGDVDGDGDDDLLALQPVNVGFGSTRPRVFLGGTTITELSNGLPQMEAGPVAAIIDATTGSPLARHLVLSGTLSSSNTGLQLWTGALSGVWVMTGFLPLGPGLDGVIGVGDVDNDGDDDIVLGGGIGPAANGGTDEIYLVKTSGGGLGTANTVSALGALGGTADVVRVADVSGTPDLDIVCGLSPLPGSATPTIVILEGDGAGGFTAVPHPQGLGPAAGQAPWDLGVAHLHGAGRRDIAASLDEAGLDAWCQVETPVLGACAAGTTTGGGDLLLISSSSGGADRIVDVGVGAAFTVDVLQPPNTMNPANFIIFGRFCMPGPDEMFSLGPFGTMCFEPGIFTPSTAKFTLASTYSPTDALSLATPTPWSLNVSAGLPIPLMITFQGLVVEELMQPAIVRTTNAVVVRVE